MNNCPACGSILDTNAKFCRTCGYKILQSQNVNVQKPPPELNKGRINPSTRIQTNIVTKNQKSFTEMQTRNKAMNEQFSTESDLFNFKLDGFRKLSFTFLFLVIISALTSSLGLVFFVAFPALIFVICPKLYRYLGISKLNILFLRVISSKRVEIFDHIPGVTVKGKWFIEGDSEYVQFYGTRKMLKFIFGKWQDFIFIPLGFSIFIIRIMIILGYFPKFNGNFDWTNILFEKNLFGLILVALPIFYAIYYPIVWSWQDAEIKIANWRPSSKGGGREVTELVYASNSLRNIVSIFAGYNAFVWFANSETYTGLNFTNSWAAVLEYSIVLLVFITGIGIFQGIMYYRSGVHEVFVNNIRNYFKEKYLKNKETKILDDTQLHSGISVYKTEIIPL